MKLVQKYGLPQLAPHEVEQLVTIWHRLTPWPDVIEGLYR